MAYSIVPLQEEDYDQVVKGCRITESQRIEEKKGRGGEWARGRIGKLN